MLNPVTMSSAYMHCRGWRAQGGALVSKCRLIVSSDESIVDGVAELEKLSKKWYRIDVKLLKAVMGYRWCVEHYAPVYTVRLIAPEAVLVDLSVTSDVFDIQVGLADVVEKDGALMVVPLFKVTGVDLKKFLAGESQFARALAVALTEWAGFIFDLASKTITSQEALTETAERLVSSTPNALEILSMFMRRYNVSGRDILDFVVKELEAERRLGIAPAKELAKETTGGSGVEAVMKKLAEAVAGGGGGGGGSEKE